MRSFILLAVAVSASAYTFSTGEMPKCSVDSKGHTVVMYSQSKALHKSFLCNHSGSTCTCVAHPTHHYGSCKQFHDTSGKRFDVHGDCTDSGRKPIDGQWSSFGGWTTCSKTCGGGSQTRTRSCDNPAPKWGGKACTGSNTETRTCNTKACCITTGGTVPVTDCVWTNHKDSYNNPGNRDRGGYPASKVNTGDSGFSRYRVGHHEYNIRMSCKIPAGTTVTNIGWAQPSSTGCGGSSFGSVLAVGVGNGVNSFGTRVAASGRSGSVGISGTGDRVMVELRTGTGCSDAVTALQSITVTTVAKYCGNVKPSGSIAVSGCTWTNHKDSYNNPGNRDRGSYPASKVNTGDSGFSRYRVGHHEYNIRMSCSVPAGTMVTSIGWAQPSSTGCGGSSFGSVLAVGVGNGVNSFGTRVSASGRSGSRTVFAEGNRVMVELKTGTGCSDAVTAMQSITVQGFSVGNSVPVSGCTWTNHKDSYNNPGNRDRGSYPASKVNTGDSGFSRYRVGHHEYNIRMSCKIPANTKVCRIGWAQPSSTGCGGSSFGSVLAVGVGNGVNSFGTRVAASGKSGSVQVSGTGNRVMVELKTGTGCSDAVTAMQSITVLSC